MPLRDYQEAAVPDIREAITRYGSAVYVLSTGAGKTVVAGEIARLAGAKGSRTVFLVHRRELVRQAVHTFEEACPGLSIGVEAPGWPAMPWANLQVGTVQTIVRKPYNLKPDLVMIDEAHHVRAKTWEKVLDSYPNAKLVGLTATPERLDGQGLGRHFAQMVMGPTIEDLVDQGYLAPTHTLRIPSSLRLSDVKKDKKGEYRQADVSERITGAVIADAANAYVRYALGKKAIFFGVHTDHSKRVCAALRDLGVRAEHVDGTDSTSRRDRVMQEFSTGGAGRGGQLRPD